MKITVSTPVLYYTENFTQKTNEKETLNQSVQVSGFMHTDMQPGITHRYLTLLFIIRLQEKERVKVKEQTVKTKQ